MGYGHAPLVLSWKPCTRVATNSRLLSEAHGLLGNSIVASSVFNIKSKAAIFVGTSDPTSRLLIWMSRRHSSGATPSLAIIVGPRQLRGEESLGWLKGRTVRAFEWDMPFIGADRLALIRFAAQARPVIWFSKWGTGHLAVFERAERLVAILGFTV